MLQILEFFSFWIGEIGIKILDLYGGVAVTDQVFHQSEVYLRSCFFGFSIICRTLPHDGIILIHQQHNGVEILAIQITIPPLNGRVQPLACRLIRGYEENLFTISLDQLIQVSSADSTPVKRIE